MRFQRHAKIFRGQLDPAPVAGVFFCLIIFVLLGSLLYTPGVLVELKNGQPATGEVVSLMRTGAVLFAGTTYDMAKSNDVEQLRLDLRNVPPEKQLQLKTEPGTSAKLRDQVRNLLLVEPPFANYGTDNPVMYGTENPVVIVAVNPRGQFFCENQMLQESFLRELLQKRCKAAAQESKNLTLVVLADRSVTEEVIVRVCALAGEAGVKEVLLPTRPGPFSKRPARQP